MIPKDTHKSAGHKVVPAYDGAEALQVFNQGEIDLIVLDIMLPKIMGVSVLHEIVRPANAKYIAGGNPVW